MNRIRIAAVSFLVACGLIATPAISATPEEKGFEIAARSDRSDRGFGDSEVSLKMVLRNSAGQESSRSLTISTLEIPDESVGDKSLVQFDGSEIFKREFRTNERA